MNKILLLTVAQLEGAFVLQFYL